MIDSPSPADVANAECFARVGLAANAESAAAAREEFADWLGQFFDLDSIRRSDLVLAVNEALANAAEFAYWEVERPGTMDLRASYDDTQDRLTVTVSDAGTWRPTTGPLDNTRGRGIPLMRALADTAAIDAAAAGTKVCLEWKGVRPA